MSTIVQKKLRKVLTFFHIPIKKRVFILTFQSEPNYGQQLQNYALSEKIKELGFYPRTIRWWRSYYVDLGIRNHALMRFRREHIFSTKPIFTEKQLKAIMREGSIVIIGGDQVFGHMASPQEYLSGLRFAGDFVSGRKVLASYAASFGKDSFKANEYILGECKKLLSRFDRLSVREKSGVDILKEVFGVKGMEVLDPVFLLTIEHYEQLINSANNLIAHDFDYIAYACLDNERSFIQVDIDTDLAVRMNGMRIINVMLQENQRSELNTVEQWLYDIKHAKFVITNSFHAVAFSIIFKRPFVFVSRNFGGNDRIKNLLGKFNLGQCWLENIGDIKPEDLSIRIDWDSVYKNIEELRPASERFLKDVLSIKPTYKKPYINLPLRRIRKKYERAYLLRLKSRKLETKAQNSLHLKIGLKHRVIRIIIKYLVSKRRYKELKTNPDLFFRNINSGFIRFLGLYYI